MRCWRIIWIISLATIGCAATSPDEFITAEHLRAEVAYLSDDQFAGRAARSDEAKRVAKYIADRFTMAGLQPLPGGDGYFHAVSDERMAPNVVGVRRGAGDDLVLITAHFDHLPPASSGDDRIYNGADDNASGVAGVLAIADALHSARVTTDASIIFVAFTGEEVGLRGSRHLAGKPPFDLRRVRGMFNMEMISRGEEDLIFIDGARNADNLRDALRRANESARLGLRLRFDEHPDWLQRSDQGPFIYRKIPAVLLSVEDHEDYHEVSDEVERILPKLTERVARLVLLAAIDIANRPPAPTTLPGPPQLPPPPSQPVR
jgi:Zn-dependent M28 family amino/carboxypeptidase